MNERGEQIEAAFHAAQDCATREERERCLAGLGAADPDLRREVEALLASSEAADAVFPAAEDAPPGVEFAEKPGTKIGRYKLQDRIGEGGMGVVYRAEQQEPVRRMVALKVIKLGMDTRQVVARFEAERQALALMDHPNIAKVLDGGVTAEGKSEGRNPKSETNPNSEGSPSGTPGGQPSTLNPQPPLGRPYFVMELVAGEPITVFCAKHEHSLEQRLRLFMPVCQAVQHAHQKGIIHRDLKPSNVMVTLQDGVPVPKVIDFGVAKALHQRLTEKTLFTQHATLIGTPAYMSPEQAELSGVDVDTRSDIYSLGVLLYELLTGTQPFPEERLRGMAYSEMQRIILHEEPERPSTRLRKTAATATPPPPPAADHRSLTTRPRSLITDHRLLATDLDWIVLKCLEKDRNRRYETANGLAADLGRFLSHEPVVARPPNRWYAFRKTVRRHHVGFAAAVGVVAALAVGLAVSGWQAIRANREEARAKLQLRAIVELLGKTFDSVVPDLADIIGAAGPREGLSKAAASIVEELLRGAEPPLEMRPVVAKLYLHLSFVESHYAGSTTGEFAEGLSNAHKAIRVLELPGWETREDDRRFGLANAEMCAGLAARGLLQFEEALHHFESMERWADRLKVSSDPTAKEHGRERGEAARWLAGMTLLSMGRADTAMTDYFRPLLTDLERRERLGGQNERPSSEDWRDVYDSLGRCDSVLGRRREAERWFRQALPFATALVEDNPSHSKYACYLAESKARLGEALLALGKPAEALPLLEESAQMAQSLRKRDPRNPGFVELQVNVLQSHAEGYVAWAADPAAPAEERTRRLDRGQAYLDQATRLMAGLSSASFRRFLDAGLRGTAAALEGARKTSDAPAAGAVVNSLRGPTP